MAPSYTIVPSRRVLALSLDSNYSLSTVVRSPDLCFMVCNSFIDSAGSLVVLGCLSFLMTEALHYNNSAYPRKRISDNQNFLSDLCRRPV